MNRFSSVVLAVAVLALAIGCGGGGSDIGVAIGDRLEVISNIDRARFEATYSGEPREDGWFIEIRVGTVLEVLNVPTRDGGSTITVRPVKATVERVSVNDEGVAVTEEVETEDEAEIRTHFVPNRYMRPDFLRYVTVVDAGDIGTVVRKLE